MKSAARFILPVILCLFITGAYAQKTGKNLYTDFDLLNIRGSNLKRPGNSDSSGVYVYCNASNDEKPKKIKLVEYYKPNKFRSRKATIRQRNEQTIIGFKMYKDYGFEKVWFIGSRIYYFDSILVCHDTISYKQWVDGSLTLVSLLPVRNDTLVIRRINKYYGHYDYPTEPWKNLAAYRLWFGVTDAGIVTNILVKKDDHYELVSSNTNGKPTRDYEYELHRKQYQKAGLSLFWMVVNGNIYL